MNRILAACLMGAAIAVPVFGAATTASAQVSLDVEVAYGPPPLPWYAQPPCPGDGYLWTPGYWAYGPWGYYWVPGAWVLAPAVGLVWTPGYWAWNEGLYWWHAGYWGSMVGFYGGIDYGYGYPGDGYFGGYWRRGAFYYNRAITNVNVTYIHNTYNQIIVNAGPPASRISYNGGSGGIHVQPTASQWRYARERHMAPVDVQLREARWARDNPAQRFALNQGRPRIAAAEWPGEFGRADAMRRDGGQAGNAYRPAEPRPMIQRPQFQDTRGDQARNAQAGWWNRMRGEQQVQAQRRPWRTQYPAARVDEFRDSAPAHAVIPQPAASPMYARPFIVRPQVLRAREPDAGGHWPQTGVDRNAWREDRSPVFRPEALRRAPAIREAPRVEVRPSMRNNRGPHGSGRPR